MSVWRPVLNLIAASTLAGSSWFIAAPFPAFTFAAAPSSGSAGVDPAQAAREVLLDQDFWWKRVEPRSVSTSWLDATLEAVWNFLARTLRAFGEWLRNLFRSLRGVFSGDPSSLTTVIWLVAAALLAWSTWKLYPVIMRWLGGATAPRSLAAGTQGGVAYETLAEASELFEESGQAFRDGLYADAIRLALLALIARLEKQGLLRYDTTRTNREYQADLRQTSELAACFGQLARIYERVWYGREPAGRAEAEQAIRLCDSVVNGEELAPE